MVTPTKGKSISERPSHHILASVNERRKNSKDAVVLSRCGSMSRLGAGTFLYRCNIGPIRGDVSYVTRGILESLRSSKIRSRPPASEWELSPVLLGRAGLVITKCPLQDKLNIHYHHQDILPSLTTLLCYVVMVKTGIGGANQILIQWRWRLNIQWFQFNVYFTVLWRVLNHVIQKHFCEQQQTSVEFRFGLSLI